MRHGFLLIDKPEGMTSHDVVARVRKTLHEPSIGHLGTLDPLATGLLVLAVGKKALKVVEYFSALEKTYEARITFGKVSATYDREGPLEEVIPKPGWSAPPEIKLRQILEQHFLGDITQTPPAHSAIHIDGKRAYKIIRDDPEAALVMPERTVKVRRIQLISYQYPAACISVTCSSGTYIRSLANDLGNLVRSGAYLESLRRLRVGEWKIEDATSLENVTWAQVMPLKDILLPFPRLELNTQQWNDIQNGRYIEAELPGEPTVAWFEGLPVAIVEKDEKREGWVHPRKVL